MINDIEPSHFFKQGLKTMNGFKELRENIDSLIDEIKSWIKKKSIFESIQRIEKANESLAKLKQISQGDIQNRVVLNRIFELESLAKKVDEILSKREVGKKRMVISL